MYMKYFIVSIYFTCYFNLTTNSSLEYGSLTMKVNKYELCKGPKRRDCCVPAVRLTGDAWITQDLLIKEDFILTNGRVVATAGPKNVLKFQVKKPCEHFLMKTLFKIYLNITDKCELTKGHYVFTTNVQDISQKYYDGKYYYGNWTFKSIFYGNDCNFFCTIMHVAMIPKKKL